MQVSKLLYTPIQPLQFYQADYSGERSLISASVAPSQRNNNNNDKASVRVRLQINKEENNYGLELSIPHFSKMNYAVKKLKQECFLPL